MIDSYTYIPYIASDCQETIVLYTSLGVVMTGSNLRKKAKLSIEASGQEVDKSFKKEKSSKRPAADDSIKNKKKDAFSRGSHRM
jgi:hypothetical protein